MYLFITFMGFFFFFVFLDFLFLFPYVEKHQLDRFYNDRKRSGIIYCLVLYAEIVKAVSQNKVWQGKENKRKKGKEKLYMTIGLNMKTLLGSLILYTVKNIIWQRNANVPKC